MYNSTCGRPFPGPLGGSPLPPLGVQPHPPCLRLADPLPLVPLGGWLPPSSSPLAGGTPLLLPRHLCGRPRFPGRF